MKRDVYQEVTDKIIAAIEAAQASGNRWRLPWRKVDGLQIGRPHNATTRNAYHGINTALLWMAADEAGYTDARWATFKQWQAVGAHVRKGERGTQVVFYKKLDIKDRETGEKKSIPLLRFSYVFNIAQVENVPERLTNPAPVEALTGAERIAAVDAFIAATGADIRHGGNSAFYVPSMDFVQMPKPEQFTGDAQRATEGYYSTLLHELGHWTGHKSRLDRNHSGGFGSKAYAFEELIAELSAAFMCADLGISNEPREDHAQYLASWLKCLRDDPRAIFKAAAAAEKAAAFLHAVPADVAEEEEEPAEALAIAA